MDKWSTNNPPKKRGRYLVTVVSQFGDRIVMQADRSEYPKDNWVWYLLPGGGYTSDVVAWQKCPEPYKEELND